VTADVTGKNLRERYGIPQMADAAMVAALLGRDDIDPGTAIAYGYPTAEAFEAFADANRRDYGHETLGPVTGPDGQLYGLTILNMDARAARDANRAAPLPSACRRHPATATHP
jgi:hypothetical protein